MDASLFAGKPLSDQFILGARLGIGSLSGLLLAYEYEKTDNSLGTVTKGKFEHTIDASLTGFVLQPELSYIPLQNLYFGIGPRILFLGNSEFIQKEKILEPTDVTFENDKITRNEFEDKIPGINPLQIGLALSASYFFPVNNDNTAFVGPYLSYNMNFTDIVDHAMWKANTLSFGVSLRYDLLSKQMPVVIPPPADTIVPEKPVVRDSSLISGILKVFYHDESGDDTIVVENAINRSYEALLNYIFFDNNSAALPGTLTLLSPGEAAGFSLSSLSGTSKLSTYYNLLNIFGYRLKTNPALSFEIIGCNSGSGAEKDNLALSRQRALAVRNYLTGTWGIDSSRLKVSARHLPENPSRSENEFAEQENRRVELIPNMPDALMPVMLEDTTRYVNEKAYMEFYPELVSRHGIHRWSVDVKQKGRLLKSFTGTGTPPGKTVWDLSSGEGEIPAEEEKLDISLSATDSLNTTRVIPADAMITVGKDGNNEAAGIKVKQVVIKKTKTEKFNLILFGFNDSNISEVGKLVTDFIKTRIEEGSQVMIEGYTDIIGNDEYNRKLARSRAETVAKSLDIDLKFAKGMGTSSELYDNNIPEGRYYNRTVIITVETSSSE